MEELSQNKGVKYSQIQQKLQMLAQSKLQNLGQTTIRRIQERLIALEKGISEEIASNQKIMREYKLLLHKYQQQWKDIELKNNQASLDRTEKISELKDLMAEYFEREDKDGQQIFKQAPRHFEEKTERVAQELCQQISQRRQQIGQLQMRVQEVLQTFRDEMHRELSELDEKSDEKIEQLRGDCQSLRCAIFKKTQDRGQTEAVLMEQIRNTVCEIKQSITNQKSQRQKNKDKLMGLVANAKQMIAKQ